jgi:hypothetical protein
MNHHTPEDKEKVENVKKFTQKKESDEEEVVVEEPSNE